MELRVFLISAPPGGQASATGGYRDEAARAEYVWDVHGYDTTGHPVAAWIGLRMRDAGPLHPGGGAGTDASIWWGGPREPVLTGISGEDGATRPAYVPREPVS